MHRREVVTAPVVSQSCEIVTAVGAQAVRGDRAAHRQIAHHHGSRKGERLQLRSQRYVRPPQAERVGEQETARPQTTRAALRRREQQIAAPFDEDLQFTTLRSAPQNPGGIVAARTAGGEDPTGGLTDPDPCGADQPRAAANERRDADRHLEEGRRQGRRRYAGQQESGIAHEVKAQIAAARDQRRDDDEEPSPVRGRGDPRQAEPPHRPAPERDATSLRASARSRCRRGSHAG